MDSRRFERGYYVEGNTARKLAEMPVRQKVSDERKEKKTNTRINKNSRRARAFDLGYMISLTMATAFLFVSCIWMLSLQEEISEQRRNIAGLEKSINELTDKNNETNKRLDSMVDLTKVYDVAINELGMIYPKNGQVVSYEASNPDYVKQFKNIPTD